MKGDRVHVLTQAINLAPGDKVTVDIKLDPVHNDTGTEVKLVAVKYELVFEGVD